MLKYRLTSPKFLLILICLLFLLTRFYKISEIPPSVYWDEASIGYNAYSILKTGKDEWGDFLPIHFRAFGEFKLPVFIYSVIPFMAIFGLNELSVRLPSVLYSLGVVILTYLLARKISNKYETGLLAAFFMTISGWFFIFSRIGYEVTAGLMFYLLGIYFILRVSPLNGFSLLLSISSFVLSMYSYNSFRILVPLTILILIAGIRENIIDKLKRLKIWIIISSAILLLAFLPIYRLYKYDAGISRYQVVGGVTVGTFLENYLSHFGLDFLFLYGDKNQRSQQSNFGQIYLIDLPFVIAGVTFLLRKSRKYAFILIFLSLLGPIPASITKESPHALRALSTVPFISIISAFGVIYLSNSFRKAFLFKITTIAVFLGFFLIYFLTFLDRYPSESSKEWQFGYKKIFIEYGREFNKYKTILVSDTYAQPYIFALFYLKYDPEKFRSEVVRNAVSEWGFSTVSSFGKYRFGKVNEMLEEKNTNRLIFAPPDEKITNAVQLKRAVKFLNRDIAFLVYE